MSATSRPCALCGGSVDPKRTSGSLCFICAYWSEAIEQRDDPNSVRIDGVHYVIGPETPMADYRGFGGTKFVVHFRDGRRTPTSNLWCQGDIPARFRAALPDNAEMIEEVPRLAAAA